MTFSEMLVKTRNITVENGERAGMCCICGKHTEKGHRKKFGGNFTCADYVSNGNVICPECYHLVRNSNEYRRTMFLLTDDCFKAFKKQEAKEVVFNLPDKPFYLYLTKTWQKIGWIRMNEVFNNGNDGDIRFLVDYDIITCSLAVLKGYCDFIGELRELKIPKTVFETGNLEMHHYRKIKEKYGKSETRRIVEKIKALAGNPAFDLALYLEK